MGILARANALNGQDVCAMHADERGQTRVDGAVPRLGARRCRHEDTDHHGAGAAAALAARELGALEPLGPDELEQSEVWVGVVDGDPGRVEGEGEGRGGESRRSGKAVYGRGHGKWASEVLAEQEMAEAR